MEVNEIEEAKKQFAQKSKLFGEIKLFKVIDAEEIAEQTGDKLSMSVNHALVRHKPRANLRFAVHKIKDFVAP